MIEISRKLNRDEKADCFDRVMSAFLKWNNCPLEDLRRSPDTDYLHKYSSRQEAAGYEVFCMLMDEDIVRGSEDNTPAGAQRSFVQLG
jgi:hypothetical protein